MLPRLRRAYSRAAVWLLNGAVAAATAALCVRSPDERPGRGPAPSQQLAASVAIEYEPYTAFRPRPVRSTSLNVSSEGYRLGSRQGPWPPEADACSVFVFGGATVFGLGAPDDATLPSLIGERLSAGSHRPVHVYNFGRPGYASTQERLLLQSLLASGHVARVHLFIDGPGEFLLWPRPLTADNMRHALEAGGAAQETGAADWPWSRSGPVERPPDADSAMRTWLANKRIVEEMMAEFDSHALFAWLAVESWPAAGPDVSLAGVGGEIMDGWRRVHASDPSVLWLGEGAAPRWDEIARRISDHVAAQGLLECRGPRT